MPRAEVPDTSVFITVFRDPDTWPAFQEAIVSGRFWLSSLVIAELYAGTRSRADSVALDRIVAAVARVDRVLTPKAGDWARAGRLLARRIRLQGSLRPRDHLADVLIVVSAARLGGTVITANVRHFSTWVEPANEAGIEVGLTPFRP